MSSGRAGRLDWLIIIAALAVASVASGLFFWVAQDLPEQSTDVSVHGNTPPIWSSTKSKSGVENAHDHFTKHGGEFPEFQDAKQYIEGVHRFINQPPAGTLTKARPNGDVLFFDPATNTFAVRSANGAPRTMFRPTDGIHYWNRQ
jgi:pyocin large subunit-like protein